MDNTQITIRYGDKFGDNAGSTAVKLPAWLEDAPLPKINGFLKLAARHAAEYDNHAEIIRLEAYLTKAIAEAEAELAEAKKPRMVDSDAAKKELQAEKRRIENWIKRLQKIRENLAAALEKYYPKRKNDQGGK